MTPDDLTRRWWIVLDKVADKAKKAAEAATGAGGRAAGVDMSGVADPASRSAGPEGSNVQDRERSSSSRTERLLRRQKAAVTDVSMEIQRNEITALIGPSGCGKSTLIRCLNRMNDLIPSAPRSTARSMYHGQDLYGAEHRPGRGPQADRHGLPEAEPVPEVDLRQRRLRAARSSAWTTSTTGSRAALRARCALGRGQGPPGLQRLRDVGRPAAAALHRPLRSRSTRT